MTPPQFPDTTPADGSPEALTHDWATKQLGPSASLYTIGETVTAACTAFACNRDLSFPVRLGVLYAVTDAIGEAAETGNPIQAALHETIRAEHAPLMAILREFGSDPSEFVPVVLLPVVNALAEPIIHLAGQLPSSDFRTPASLYGVAEALAKNLMDPDGIPVERREEVIPRLERLYKAFRAGAERIVGHARKAGGKVVGQGHALNGTGQDGNRDQRRAAEKAARDARKS